MHICDWESHDCPMAPFSCRQTWILQVPCTVVFLGLHYKNPNRPKCHCIFYLPYLVWHPYRPGNGVYFFTCYRTLSTRPIVTKHLLHKPYGTGSMVPLLGPKSYGWCTIPASLHHFAYGLLQYGTSTWQTYGRYAGCQ